MDWLLNVQSLAGFAVLLALAWLLSENRQRVTWRLVLWGSALQFGLAVLLLKVPLLHQALLAVNDAVLALQAATVQGTSLVFGYLGGANLPFEETAPGGSFVLAFQALPLVMVISALTALLMYWRVLPRIIQAFAWLLQKSLGVSGSIGLSTAANIFVGMVEAPILIRPWLSRLTRSELFVLMTAGMATIAGTVLMLYATFLGGILDNAVAHLLTASLISAPAAIVIARLMVPETQTPTADHAEIPQTAHSSMDAITQGTQNGLQLFLNIIAMLIVLVALVHLLNSVLGLLPHWQGEALSLQRLLGYVMAPIAWLMGIPWQEASTAGALLGVKTVLNELLAYLQLAQLPADSLSPRSQLIVTYALCGFANFGSLGIMLAGLTTMAPQRRDEILGLGMKSIVAGTLATCCTGAVVGVLS